MLVFISSFVPLLQILNLSPLAHLSLSLSITHLKCYNQYLEDHLVGLVATFKGKQRGHVLFQVRHGADGGANRGVQSFVCRDVLSRQFLSRRRRGKETILRLGRAVLRRLFEVFIVKRFAINFGNVNLGGGGDGVSLVQSLHRHAVDAIRAAHQQQTRI